jgi:hypothetical protein
VNSNYRINYINEQYFILEHNETAALIYAKKLLKKYESYTVEANSKFIFALNIAIIIHKKVGHNNKVYFGILIVFAKLFSKILFSGISFYKIC